MGIDPSLLDAASDNIDVGDDDDGGAGDEHDDNAHFDEEALTVKTAPKSRLAGGAAKPDATKKPAVARLPAESHDVDALLAHDDDNVHVDVSDSELNDPSLLAELREMTGMHIEDEVVATKPAPTKAATSAATAKQTSSAVETTKPTAQSLEALDERIAQLKKQCLELKRAGQVSCVVTVEPSSCSEVMF